MDVRNPVASVAAAASSLIPVGVGLAVNADGAHTTSGTSRLQVLVPRAVTDISWGFHNVFSDTSSGVADKDGAGPVTLGMATVIDGVVIPHTFHGAAQVTVAPGGRVQTDPLPIDVAAGTLVEVRTFFAAGSTWYGQRVASAYGYGGWTATTDLTLRGAAAVADAFSGEALTGPSVLLGRPTGTDRRALLVQGDSIAEGVGDALVGRGAYNMSADGLGRGGYLARAAAAAGVGLIQTGTASDRASYFVQRALSVRRQAWSAGATCAVVAYGRNDLSANRTVAQLQGDILTIVGRNKDRGIPSLVATILPYTQTTNAWRTTAAQTQAVSTESSRLTYNQWLRAGAPMAAGAPVAYNSSSATDKCAVYSAAGALVSAAMGAHPFLGVIDPAATVESASVWAAPTVIRQVTAVTTANGFAVNATDGAFVAADLGRSLMIPGAGAAGALAAVTITGIYSSTQVGISAGTPTAVSVTADVTDSLTWDGLHPAPAGHRRMAAAVPSSVIV